ncbi:MAG: ABC transporter permease [Dehalococcoidia bacterium]|nr:ABC transporter permease [Dehalococcoidia bacterium]
MTSASPRDVTALPEAIALDRPRAGRRSLTWLVPPAVFAVILGAWETAVRALEVKAYLLPPPSAVARALLEEPGRFAVAAAVSLEAALGGLAIATLTAFALAAVMAHSRPLERALYPPALLLKVTPIVAVYPLLTIWFGFGMWPKMLVVALITFFPTLVNALVGLRSVNQSALDFLHALHASRSQVFWRLRVPSSLPYLFAALRISVPLALIGAVVAEFLSGASGMGQVILIANGDFDTAVLFGAVFVLGALGVSLTALVSYLERRVLDWHESSRGV